MQAFNLDTGVLWTAQTSSREPGAKHASSASSACTASTASQPQSRAAFEEGFAERIRELLSIPKTRSPAVVLLLQFSNLAAQHFDREAILGQLAAAGQLALAIRWATELGPSFQVRQGCG